MNDEIPRRNDMQRWSRAETMIHDALQAVEALGAHTVLTQAVVLLGEARNKVADWHDLHEEPAEQWSVLFETDKGATHPRRYRWTDGALMSRSQALKAAQAELEKEDWLVAITDVYPSPTPSKR